MNRRRTTSPREENLTIRFFLAMVALLTLVAIIAHCGHP